MADLFVMVGCPGAGKSTFLKNRVNKETSITISRDEIRFSLLQEGEDYFSRENDVLFIFYNKINEGLAAGKNVFVDQTSLTPKARKRLLDNVHGYEHANVIWIDEDLETCIKRNDTRFGTKTYVPPAQLCRMHKSLVEPSIDEGFYRIFRYNSKENQITYKGAKME